MPNREVWRSIKRLWQNQVIQADVPKHKQDQAAVSLEYFVEQECKALGEVADPAQVFVDLVEAYNRAIHERIGHLERFRDLAMAELAKLQK